MTGYQSDAVVKILVNGEDRSKQATVSYNRQKQAIVISLKEIAVTEKVEILLEQAQRTVKNAVQERIAQFLNQAEMEFDLKEELYQRICEELRVEVLLAEFHAMNLDADLYGVLVECLTAACS